MQDLEQRRISVEKGAQGGSLLTELGDGSQHWSCQDSWDLRGNRGIFLTGIYRLQSCDVPGKTSPSRKQWLGGWSLQRPTRIAVLRRESGGALTNSRGFQPRLQKGCALGGGGRAVGKTCLNKASHPSSARSLCPPVFCQPRGSMQSLYNVPFAVSVI